jgi:hypothetical protein
LKKLILFLALALINTTFAQSSKLLEDNLFKIKIISPGFGYEKSTSHNTSVAFETSVFAGLNLRDSEANYFLSPYVEGQFRNYYNLQKRISKGKSTLGNSGSYFAIQTSYYFTPINNSEFSSVYDGLNIGSVWGFQKTYISGLNIGANLGVNYNFSEKTVRKILPIMYFNLGWVFF